MKEFSIEKGNFTTVFNDIFKAENEGKKLSLEAWGLYVFMVSLPDEWDYTIRGLSKVLNAGKNKIQRILKELEIAGFILREQTTVNGKFGKMKYTILHTPKSDNTEDIFLNSPCPQKPCTENGPQQNTNITNIYNDKYMIKGKISPILPEKLHFLTKELIQKDFISILDYDLLKYDELFRDLDFKSDYQLVIAATRYLVDFMSKSDLQYSSKFSYFETAIYNNLVLLENKEIKGSITSKKLTAELKKLQGANNDGWNATF